MSDLKPLHFVVLLGSLRRGSLNRIVAEALPSLAPPGVTIELLGSVGDIPHYDADLQDDGLPAKCRGDGAGDRRCRRGDHRHAGIQLLGAGALKNALDWLSRLPNTPFTGKPVAIQTGSPGMIGGARCQYHLRQILVFLDAYVLNKPELMISQMMQKIDPATHSVADEPTRVFIGKQLQAFSHFARRQ